MAFKGPAEVLQWISRVQLRCFMSERGADNKDGSVSAVLRMRCGAVSQMTSLKGKVLKRMKHNVTTKNHERTSS